MAYPALALPAATPIRSGIPVNMIPSSDPTCDLELWRKTTASGTTFALHQTFRARSIGGNPYLYIDPLPKNGYTYTYKLRSVGLGRWPSTYTASVSGSPQDLGTANLASLALSGRGLSASLFISTGVAVKFGTAKTPKTAAKYLWVPHTAFQASSEGLPWKITATDLRPGSTGSSLQFFAAVTLPPGATVTGFRARMFRASTASLAQAVLNRVNNDTQEGVASQVTHVTTTWAEIASTTVSNALVGSQRYVVTATLTGGATPANARLGGARIDYTIPDYGVGL